MRGRRSFWSAASMLVIGGSIGLALAGCASGPDPQVLRARNAVQTARDDQYVQAYAPTTLREAEQALTRAEQADAEGADQEEVDHLAYLAEQEAAIARLRALEERSQQQLATTDEQIERELEELRAERTDRGVVITIEDVLFEVNRAELRPGAQSDLVRLADFLNQNPNSTVLVEGHTDNSGNAEYNLELSQLRALSVRDFLVANGVSPLRVRAIGYGETRPEAPNDNVAGRQQNRRVEIVIEEVEPIVRARGG
jgi:outer membrane protein OmpA-like peptidoglycan-associated protein